MRARKEYPDHWSWAKHNLTSEELFLAMAEMLSEHTASLNNALDRARLYMKWAAIADKVQTAIDNKIAIGATIVKAKAPQRMDVVR